MLSQMIHRGLGDGTEGKALALQAYHSVSTANVLKFPGPSIMKENPISSRKSPIPHPFETLGESGEKRDTWGFRRWFVIGGVDLRGRFRL